MKVDAGRIKISAAHRQTQRDQARLEAKRFAASHDASEGEGIFTDDMNCLWERLEDESVGMFLTDPPWDQPETYMRLGELAAAKLKPSGFVVAYIGHHTLPQAVEYLGRHLTYWWTAAVKLRTASQQIFMRHVNSCWRLVLIYQKEPLTAAPDWWLDFLPGGGADKRFHEWGQHEAEGNYFLEKFTQPGDLVCDPFAGGGAFPAACKRAGRRWVGCEIDSDMAAIARKRLAEMDESRNPAPV